MPEHDVRILGGGAFVADVLKEAEERLKRQLQLGGRSGLINRIIEKVCREDNVSEQELRRGGKGRNVSKARAKVAITLHREGVSLADIARHLGVCTSAVVREINGIQAGKAK